MASAKVTYTYKRKRLSSCSGVGHVAVCPGHTSNFEADECQNAVDGRPNNLEKDLKRPCYVEDLSHACSSHRAHKPSTCQANNSTQDSDATCKNETVLNSYDLCGDRTIKTSTSIAQSEQKDSDSLCNHNSLCDTEHVKARVATPLLTFSRRLKRKVDRKIFGDLPVEQSATCEVASSQDKFTKESLDLNARVDLETRDSVCASKDEMDNRNATESIRPPSGSCLETPKDTSSEKDLNVDMSSIMVPTVSKTLGFNPSLSPNVDEVGNNLKENVRCVSNAALLFFDDNDKTDDHHVSHQLQASDRESQLTSNSFDSKITTQIAEQKVFSSGAFVIDCNGIPVPDLQGYESHTVFNSSLRAKSHGEVMKERHVKNWGLELFGPHGVQSNNSLLQDATASVQGETKPDVKCLELFPEDVKKDTEFVCSKAKLSITSTLGGENAHLQRSSNGSAFLGLSPPSEPLLGQSSIHVRIREFIHNPPAHPSFLNHTTSSPFKHRKLLNNINTETTCPSMWTESELDSLWIGIRRHGRGNWHAMLLDPRLHFAPWRSTSDLALQWEQEQVKLLNRQHMHQDQCMNPHGHHNLDCSVGFLCSRSGLLREPVSTDTQLSLGDLYTQKACNYVRTNNIIPHWLRGIHVAHSTPVDPQITGHQLVHPYLQPSRRTLKLTNQGVTNKPIVINSDDSSEETISDDYNTHS